MSAAFFARHCWCGHEELAEYSDDYRVCRACGTLVSRAEIAPAALEAKRDTNDAFYSKDYWTTRQTDHHGFPDITKRARLDLPDRGVHWLNLLLKRRLPPAKVLEIGCAHGAYVALLRWAGYEASGTEMSPWVVQFARDTFGIPVQAGRIEELAFEPGSLDVIVLNDVIEHLPTPAATLAHCATLLKPDGFFVIQTPEYKEHLTYADLKATNDLFLKHMEHNNEEHLYLFSRRSTQELWRRLGFPVIAFENPVFAYDLFYTASRTALPEYSPEAIATALARQPTGRLVQAFLDKAYESTDRWWAIQRLEKR